MKKEQKTLANLITDFAQEKGKNTLTILDSLLTYIIGFFDPTSTPIKDWTYSKEDNMKFNHMMTTYFLEMKEHLNHHEWYDIWGDLYMSLISKGDGKGQFFTPIDLCNLMAQITINEKSLEGKGTPTRFGHRVTISDCACGSARCLLAGATQVVKHTQRKPYLCGEDLDEICCKMSAINIAIHGWFGEVVCHDSICEPEKVRVGYIINQTMWPFPTSIPSIRRCDNPSEFIACNVWKEKRDNEEKKQEPKIEKKSFEVLGEEVKKKYEQLSLF